MNKSRIIRVECVANECLINRAARTAEEVPRRMTISAES